MSPELRTIRPGIRGRHAIDVSQRVQILEPLQIQRRVGNKRILLDRDRKIPILSRSVAA